MISVFTEIGEQLAALKARHIFGRISALFMLVLAMALHAAPAMAQSQTLLVNKQFADATILPNGTTTLTITLYNTDTNNAQSGVAFTDNFQSGLSWTSLVSNSCGGAITPLAGANRTTLTLTGGTLPAAPASGSSSCQIVVNVTADVAGNYTNTLPAGAVTGTAGGNPTTNGTGSSTTLTVSNTVPLTISKSFGRATIGAGSVSFFRVIIDNPNNIAVNDVSFSDALPSGLAFANFPSGSTVGANTCGPNVVPPAAGAISTSQTGIQIPALGSCRIDFAYTAAVPGSYTNTIPAGDVTSSTLGPAGTSVTSASTTVTVQSDLTVTKNYSVPTINVGEVAILTLRFENGAPAPIDNLTLTDNFPDSDSDGLYDIVVASGGVASNTCGGTVTAPPGAGLVSISGGTVPAADSFGGIGACEIRVRVRANDRAIPSVNQILPGDVTGDVGGTPVTNGNLAEDQMAVEAPGTIIFVGVDKQYSVGGTFHPNNRVADAGTPVRARIVITNPTDYGISGVVVPDTFEPLTLQGQSSDVVLASPANFSFTNCGEAGNARFSPANGFPSPPTAPSVAPTSGNSFTVSDVSLLPSSDDGACSIEFDVVGSVTGTHRNIIARGDVSGGVVADGNPVIDGVAGEATEARFTYISPLGVEKLYAPGAVTANTGVSRLRITLTNSNPSAPITGVTFTDDLPVTADASNLVAPNPSITNSCGGTVTAVAGSSTVSLSGGTIPVALAGVDGTCTIEVAVVVTDTNDGIASLRNDINASDVEGLLNGATVSNTRRARAVIRADVLDITVDKVFSPSTVLGGETSDVTLTITNPNPNDYHVFGIDLIDNLPAGMIVADPSVSSTTCTTDGLTGGPLANPVATAGDDSFELNDFTLFAQATTPPGGQSSCTVTVRVTTLQTGSIVNTIRNGDVTSDNGASNIQPFSATLTVLPNTAVSKQFMPDTIGVGGISELEIRILNANAAPANNISVTDILPPEVVIAPGPVIVQPVAGTTCPGLNVSAPAGGNTINATGLTLGANSECRFTVQVTSNTTGTWTNTIQPAQVSSDEGGIRTVDATDDLTVVNAPVVEKSFDRPQIQLGETVRLTARVSNTQASGAGLTAVAFVDNLPTGLEVAPTPNFASNGSCGTGTFSGNTAGSASIRWDDGSLAANSFCEYSIDVTAAAVGSYVNELPACDLTAATPVAGTDAAATATSGGVTVCNVAGATAPVEVIDVDLTFTKTLNAEDGTQAGIAEGGETLTYAIAITNGGSATATGVNVVDVVPANTTFVSADNGGVLNGAQVEWTLDVPVGTTTLLVSFRVVDAIPDDVTQIANSATVDGEECATLPCVVTPTESATLSIAKALTTESGATAGVAEAGESLTYTLTITNPTGANATAAAIVDTVPANTTFVSASDGGALNGAQVEWTADVPANSSITRTVTFQVADPIPAGVTQIANSATVNGTPCADQPCVETPTETATVTIAKALTAESGTQANIAEAGETLTYTITVSNATGADATGVAVVDMIPANTTFVSASNGGAVAAGAVNWTVDVPARGSTVLTAAFRVVDPIPAGVTQIANSATANGTPCAVQPCVETPTETATVTIAKALTAESGTQANIAEAGETLTYTITVSNATGANATGVAVVDMIPANTTFVSASNGGAVAAGAVNWTVDVPANGSTVLTAAFRVVDPIPAGVTQIANSATANGVTCTVVPCVVTPVETPELDIAKALTAETGPTPNVAEEGEDLTYTLTISNTSGANAVGAVITDTVPANTTFVSASDGGTLSGGVVSWTADVGANSSITRTVTFRVNDPVPANVTTIANNATVNGEGCATDPCVVTPVGRPVIEFTKVLAAESGNYPNIVEPGETLTYTITIENNGTANAVGLPVVDTLDPAATFVSADNGGTLNGATVNWTVDVNIGQTLVLTVVTRAPTPLPAGLQSIANNATVDGETCDSVPCVVTPAAQPPVAVDDNGGLNQVGLAVTLPTPGNDRPGTAPLDVTTVQIVGTSGPNQPLVVPGEGTWSVNPTTGQITFTPNLGFGGDPTPIRYTIRDTLGQVSNEAVESLEYTDDLLIRLSKQASVRTVRVGDLVLYTLTLENIGDIDIVDATLMDTPPNGFTMVAGSLTVSDLDGSGSLVSTSPIRIDDIDVEAGETATVTYLMAVGAGTLPGTHTNVAITLSNEVPISNEATATVTSAADPLLDESLIIGTVFEDRDEDAWQDPASATDVMIRGGVDESAYVAGSTTIDRGNGPEVLADASAPINHGIAVGMLKGRNGIAQPASANQVVISMRMREPRFTDDLVLTTGEGTKLMLDAAGNSSVEQSGEVKRGLNGQDVKVSRVVTPVNGEYRVDYVITNEGIDERGLAGVRIGTVEGLVVETDGYGRFHLTGIAPHHFARGSNFIMKVDTATLPKGSVMTTENPRIRRITPGLPVRFDFGVKIPETVIEGSIESVDMSLGEFVFEANSAVLKDEYQPVINHMAAQVRKYDGGDIVIDGRGGTPELALSRAEAVHDALKAALTPDLIAKTNVKVTGEVDGPEVLTYGLRTVIGEVFFDTDKTAIRPEYVATVARIANEIAEGDVKELLITGHADKRASDAYNIDLGRRRAQSVYRAIIDRLPPDMRDDFRVEYLPPSTPESPYESGRGE